MRSEGNSPPRTVFSRVETHTPEAKTHTRFSNIGACLYFRRKQPMEPAKESAVQRQAPTVIPTRDFAVPKRQSDHELSGRRYARRSVERRDVVKASPWAEGDFGEKMWAALSGGGSAFPPGTGKWARTEKSSIPFREPNGINNGKAASQPDLGCLGRVLRFRLPQAWRSSGLSN